jgi:RNA polymerase sporulation-specific sigma factor
LRNEDLELLHLARSGNNDATNELLVNHKHLVVAIARKYYLIGGDKDDLIQEGMIGLFKAISSFDEAKNNNFVGYATTLIEREIISAIRHANTHAQQVLSESVLIDNDDELPDSASPETDLISEENTIELTHEINEKLSAFERKVVEYYLKGYNYVDIAKLLNKPNKSIDNALSRIKKKLEFLKERL